MITGDWDNGIAMQMDGPYVNRGDDGNRVSGNRNPYFDEKALSAADVTNKANFSPNRVICGPGMYGSMSSGVQEGIPWRTLLFRRADTDKSGSLLVLRVDSALPSIPVLMTCDR